MSYGTPVAGSLVAGSFGTSFGGSLPAGAPTGGLLLAIGSPRSLGSTTMGISTTASVAWTAVGSVASELSAWLKIMQASEPAPTFTLSVSDVAETRIFYLPGAPASVTGLVDGTVTATNTGVPSAGSIPHGALTVVGVGDIVICAVAQRGTAWTGMTALAAGAPSPFIIATDDPFNAGTIMSLGIQYQIQTTPTNIATGNVSITGSSTNAAQALLFALHTGSVGGENGALMMTGYGS